MDHIRTWWHKLIPIFEKGQVYTSASAASLARPVGDYGFKPTAFKQFIEDCGKIPHFVIDRDLIDLAREADYQKSLIDMKRADILRLPFKELIVEYPDVEDKRHFIAIIREATAREQFDDGSQFVGTRLTIERDKDGEYLVVSPASLSLGLTEKDGVPHISFGSSPMDDLFRDDNLLHDLMRGTWRNDASTVFTGLCAALLLMTTRGVHKDVIDPVRLNKKRRAAGKTIIPTHTYVYIGRVYASAGSDRSDQYVPRKSPRPHWRRGHNRTIRIGQGRTGSKLMYIPGKIVSCATDMKPEDVKVPVYHVRS